jgi:transcriptional regulator with XRE-family HTH domain
VGTLAGVPRPAGGDGPAGLPGGCGLDAATRRRSVLFPPLLRALREMSGLTAARAAALAGGRDRTWASRVENGERGISMDTLAVLLAAYGFDAGSMAYRSLMGAAATPYRDWWTRYPAALEGDRRAAVLLEQAAVQVLAWQPAGVPELAQTRDWALACARRSPLVAAGDETAYAAAVAARQDAVLRGPYPARLDVILGSPVTAAAVPQAPGQARKLTVPEPGTSVRCTLAADAWLPPAGPFEVLQLDSGPAGAVVFLPGPGGGTLVTGPRAVRDYIAAFQHLDRSARTARHRGAA